MEARQPYSREPFPGDTGKERLAITSMRIALFGIPGLIFPVITIGCGIAGIILGILGLSSKEADRAIWGITLGAMMVIAGMVFMISAAVLLPYMSELQQFLATLR